jgi:hypothetical protein
MHIYSWLKLVGHTSHLALKGSLFISQLFFLLQFVSYSYYFFTYFLSSFIYVHAETFRRQMIEQMF